MPLLFAKTWISKRLRQRYDLYYIPILPYVAGSGRENFVVGLTLFRVAFMAFYNSSQICMTIKRLYVHSAIYDKFLQALAACTRTLKAGNGFTAPDAFMGPVQNEMQYEKVKTYFDDISKEGWKPVV